MKESGVSDEDQRIIQSATPAEIRQAIDTQGERDSRDQLLDGDARCTAAEEIKEAIKASPGDIARALRNYRKALADERESDNSPTNSR